MEKEKITGKIIADEIKSIYRMDCRFLSVESAISVPVLLFLCFCFWRETKHLFLPIAVTFLCTIVSVSFSAAILQRLIYIRKLDRGDFRIEVDTLAEIIQTGDVWGQYEIRSRLWLSPLSVYRLRFSRYGKILLYGGVYYRFSPTYYMTDKGVYDRAKVGEDYYLVFIGKRPVPMHLYSKELFVLKD